MPELQQRLRTLTDFAKAAGFNWDQWTRMVERAYPSFKGKDLNQGDLFDKE